MKRTSLERLAPVLEALRAHPALQEIRPTHFMHAGKEFVHFHDADGEIVADAILSKGRVSMPVNTTAEQAAFMDRIDPCLASLGSREQKRDRDRRRGASRGV